MPLHLAAITGKSEVVEVHSSHCLLSSVSPCLLQLLLEKGVEVNAATKSGDTALHSAAEYGHPTTAKASQRRYHLEF